MADTVVGEIRAASLEYRAPYETPLIGEWRDNGRIAQAVFEAFREWNITLEQISDTPFGLNFSQYGVSFQVQGRFNFRIGLGGASLSVWNPNWGEAAEIKRIALAGTEALKATGKISYSKYEVVLDIHVTPSGRSVSELTRKFVPTSLKESSNKQFIASGFTFQDSEKYWYVDASTLYPDSIFLRTFRTFPPSSDLDGMMSSLYKDELGLLGVIGITVPELDEIRPV
jgi:hypothetical protein